MEHVSCNLCGYDEARHLYTVPDLLLNRKTVQATLVQCERCGLVYQNPRPTLDEIGQHYPPQYEPHADHTEQTGRNWLARRAVQYGINKRCRFVTRHKTAGRLLDIGCAAGTFLVGMRNHGDWTLHGVELSADVARLARERHGLDVKAGKLEDAAYPDAYFDAVTMWDVLEHVHDPAGTLREIHRVLKPDGILVIRVPNLASWDAALFGQHWAGLDAPRHLYVFTPDTLTEFLALAGFEVAEHSCGIGSYMTFVLSLRFWLTGRGVAPNRRDAIATVLYHPIARLLSAPLFYLPTLTLRGPLLVTTARKARSADA